MSEAKDATLKLPYYGVTDQYKGLIFSLDRQPRTGYEENAQLLSREVSTRSSDTVTFLLVL